MILIKFILILRFKFSGLEDMEELMDYIETNLYVIINDFEGKLDREDKPLKQGRLTVVEDKPRVFIDDKSFLF